MEIAAIIALREGLGTVQLAAFIEIASFIHLAKAGNKFEAAFFFTQLTDATPSSKALPIGFIPSSDLNGVSKRPPQENS